MLNKLTATIFIFIFSTNIFPQICGCVSASPEDTTRQGGNELITLIESEIYKSVRGKVSDVNGELLEGVLVEIFDKPDWIKVGKNSPPDNQNRIHACVTDKKGNFCFPKLAKGNYEVRFSKDLRFNPTFLFIKIDPDSSKASKKSIELFLTPGT